MFRLFVFLVSVFALAASVAGQSPDARFRFPGETESGTPASAGDVPAADSDAAAELTLWDDAADGRLDRHSLLASALLASGIVSANDRDGYLRRFEHWVAELKVSGRVTGSARDRAAAIHDFLHERAFTGGFREASTSLRETFEHGRFNCISSVILFLAVAERFGLPAHGVEVPAHAYAVVDSDRPATGDRGSIVVQTTCRAWFAAEDQGLQAALLRRTLGDAAANAAASSSTGRRLSDVGLLAVVYYNRGVDQLEAGRFAEAAAANRTAIRLDASNGAARANLLATVNNWSLELGRRGELASAVRLLEEGLVVAPDYALFHENLVALHQQRLSGQVSRSGDSAPTEALAQCYRRWRAELLRRGALEAASAVDRRAAADPFLRAAP